MTESPNVDVIHRLKNHIAIIVGFTELLIAECADDDPKRADLLEVQKAAHEAMAVLPEVVRRAQQGEPE
jgi:hypothetical protein